MNSKRWCGCFAVVAAMLGGGGSAYAQGVVEVASATYSEETAPEHIDLKNGDRLTGDVVSMDSKQLVIEHGPLGRRNVPLGVVTDVLGREVHIIAEDGEEVDGTIESIADGKVVLNCEGKRRSFDIATLRSEPMGIRWSGNLMLGTNFRLGDAEYAGAIADVDVVARRDEDRLTGKFDWAFRESRNSKNLEWTTTQRRVRSELQYDYLAIDDTFVWANSSMLTDEFADIHLQWISSAGAGYEAIKEKDYGLSASAGLAYVKMNYVNAEDREFPACRAATSVWWKPASDVKVSNESSVVPSLKNGNSTEDVIVRVDTRLRWNVVDKLFAQLRWVYDYNRAPSPGYGTTDQNVSLNFGWSF